MSLEFTNELSMTGGWVCMWVRPECLLGISPGLHLGWVHCTTELPLGLKGMLSQTVTAVPTETRPDCRVAGHCHG